MGDVYVFWDVSESNLEMYTLGKDYVHRMTFDDFMRNYRSFPQETYVFDDQFEQALVLSHEYYHDHLKNLCLYIPAERDNCYRFG
jgi:hypothetical protein